jgi:hypothetical protein
MDPDLSEAGTEDGSTPSSEELACPEYGDRLSRMTAACKVLIEARCARVLARIVIERRLSFQCICCSALAKTHLEKDW